MQAFLEAHRGTVTRAWFRMVEEENQEQPYLNTVLEEYAEHFYELLIDLEVPIEQHPNYEWIFRICRSVERNLTPLHTLLEMFHLLRLSILESLCPYIFQRQIPPEQTMPAVFSLHRRIDTIQKEISNTYLQQITFQLMKQRDETIGQLHNDRLNLLGRMAASMAHELKNPLFAIEGFLQLIEAELSYEERNKVKRYLDVVQREFKGLYGQITGFLSFSRNQQMEESIISCRLSELVESVLELVRPRLNSEGVEIELDLQLDPPLQIQRVALQQVLSNLLNNSLDALSGGSYPKLIRIRSYEDENSYYIDITDYGAGVPEHLKESIFTPFVTSKSNGTGLGLPICKQIMEKNGGSISYTSDTGETVFTLQFFKDSSPLYQDEH
ncbi:HAMP domain-containing histidine kinase [Brevibacillus humidisoli]|uniref:sensor histidine kinase n=1 Tax=Brevibacillus humidisoli TaxID=2895522 RepID=UPI001E503FF4|nr:HAMP domain-containing sensor histidine kinase [Brevibacillus humidisoli]UFJ41159.1 HAMP domain-containing histidine kinase [Brevibacillus humidisoli]